MKFIKFIIMLVLVCSFLFGCAAPQDNGNNNNTNNVGENSVEIWSAPTTEKIMRDYHDYDNVKDDGKIEIFSARNEYESAQLIITPTNDVKSYEIVIADLKMKDNSAVILSADNAVLYNQKYIKVEKITTTIAAPIGWYPDALLPFEKAVEYSENHIKGGDNQGIWLTYKIPQNQQNGVYTGSFTLKIDGVNHDIPVSVTVWDYEITTKVNNKSIFQFHWRSHSGDLDSSQDMVDLYTQALIEYRLAPYLLVQDNGKLDSDIQYYVDLAYSYAIREDFSNYAIPIETVKEGSSSPYPGETNIDVPFLNRYLDALIAKSVEKNFDMFEKLLFRLGIIDEPSPQNYGRVILVANTLTNALNAKADEVDGMSDIDANFRTQLSASLRNVKHPVTTSYNDALKDAVDTWCPGFAKYDTEADREKYASQEEKWWYGCINPKNPYPTYHLDDNLISSRILSWMQADYDVVGNLYWSINLYSTTDTKTWSDMEDYYSTPERWRNCNGDGFLFYPGKVYGIDGPVGTIRIQSIRDGLEEYETLLALENVYSEISSTYNHLFSSDQVLRQIYDTLYSGTKVQTTSSLFTRARHNLAELTLLANSSAEVAITQVNVEDNKVIYKVIAKDGFVLKNNEVPLTTFDQLDGAKLYTVEVMLSSGQNQLNLSVEVDNKILTLNIVAGGAADSYQASDIVDSFAVSGSGTAVVVDTSTVIPEETGELVKLQFKRAPLNGYQNVAFTNELLDNIGSNTSKLKLVLYNPSDADVEYRLRFKYSNKDLYYAITSGSLKPGYNEIVITNIFGYNWTEYGKLKEISMNIGEKFDNARDIYVKSLTCYYM